MARTVAISVLLVWLYARLADYAFDGLLHIVFCDVGQGDATLIRLNNTQLLIDGGRDDSVLQCLDQHMPPWDKKLEVVVATHPDADHITGLASVLENYQVEALLHNGQGKETADFERFKAAVQKVASQGASIIAAQQGDKIEIGDKVYISVLYPEYDRSRQSAKFQNPTESLLSDVSKVFVTASDDANDHSIVLKLMYKNLDVLLMADLEEAGEKALMNKGLITDVEVLKVGHHGAKTSSTLEFLGQSRPEISVISAGKNNSYGHPHPLVTERLTRAGSLILRTDQDSSIELVSNGLFLKRRVKVPLLNRVMGRSSSRGKSLSQLPK